MKKLAIIASITALGALSAVGFASVKTIEVKAEGEDTSQVVSSSQEQSSSQILSSEESKPSTWEEVQNVKVEGKTIKEWIEGIKNEETRRSTIFALGFAVVGTMLIVLKWLTERGLIKKGNEVSKLNLQAIEEFKKQAQGVVDGYQAKAVEVQERLNEVVKDYEAKAIEMHKKLEEAQAKVAEQTDKMAGLLSKDGAEREAIRVTLLQMLKDNPDYVAAGTFKKVRSYLEVKEDGKEE